MSPQATRKNWIFIAAVFAFAVMTLYISFQKAIGDTINEFAKTSLDFNTAILPRGEATTSITIRAIDVSNAPVQGIWATIQSNEGTILGSGYTPFTFSVNGTSAEYSVTVADFDGKVFQSWQDTGSADRTREFTAPPSSESTTITAVYDTGDALRGFTPLTYSNTENQKVDLTLHSVTADGSKAEGLYAIIDPQPSNSSATVYKVYAGDFQGKIFDHWEDNEGTDRTRTVVIEENTTITAVYNTGGGEAREKECNLESSPYPKVSIQDPIEGQAINEATYEISGTAAGTDICAVENVYLRIVDANDTGKVIADYQPVSDVSPPEGPAWSDWIYQQTFPADGNYLLEAKIVALNGHSSTDTVSISVDFSGSDEEPPIVDNIKPTVTIISPSDGAVITGPSSGAIVGISGMASDELSKLQNVWVRVDKGPYRAVTPQAPGDWSTWTHSAIINTEGIHEITAKASDIAKNPQWHTINVTVSLMP
jgi:hypothetical protein